MRKLLVVVALAAAVLTGSVAHAGGPSLGRCRMQVTELQAEIRVHYVLRTPSAGRRWRFKIFDDGVRVFRKVYRTDENGNFGVWVKIPRLPGYRRYVGVATDLVTRDRCAITLRT